MGQSVYFVHIQTEASEHYYHAWKEKPTKAQILAWQKQVYMMEYQEEPTSTNFTDLVSIVREGWVDYVG